MPGEQNKERDPFEKKKPSEESNQTPLSQMVKPIEDDGTCPVLVKRGSLTGTGTGGVQEMKRRGDTADLGSSPTFIL